MGTRFIRIQMLLIKPNYFHFLMQQRKQNLKIRPECIINANKLLKKLHVKKFKN